MEGTIQEIRERLNKFIKETPGISNRIIADNTGYSTGYISLFRNNKFPNEKGEAELAEKVESYINNEEASIENAVRKGHLNFAFTTAAHEIFYVAHYALTENVFGVVSGVPGCGKTISVQAFKKRNPTSILIEVTPLVTQLSLLHDICNELKIPVFTYRNDRTIAVPRAALFDQICIRLKGTRRLLIVDEGENLTVACLEIIRRIQDFTGIGILLSGTKKLLDRLRGSRRELQQLFSRVGIQKEIELLKEGDIKLILNLNYPEGIKFSKTFMQLSKNNGRLLEHLINLVKKTIKDSGEELSDELIDDCAASLLT